MRKKVDGEMIEEKNTIVALRDVVNSTLDPPQFKC